MKSSHKNVKGSGGVASLARVVQALVDEDPSSESGLSEVMTAHRAYNAAIQVYFETQAHREAQVIVQLRKMNRAIITTP